METKSATDNKEKHGMKKQANIITHLLNLLAKDSEKMSEDHFGFSNRDSTLDLLFVTNIRQLNFPTYQVIMGMLLCISNSRIQQRYSDNLYWGVRAQS